MKNISIFCSSLLLCFQMMFSPGVHGFCSKPDCGLLVGQPAPGFSANAVVQGEIVDNFSLKDLNGKYVVLLFYPLDFTFICPTELHAFQAKVDEFAARNAQVVACSVDSAFSHFAWLNTPKEMGGIQGVEYPIISDFNKSISNSYQVLSEGVAYRGLFIIDRQGMIRHQLINDLPIGRNVDEVLRTLDALITYENIGEVCPANWMPGDKTLKPTTEGLLDYLNE
jgi:peroxiredoxin (alkyl hydroperoxide reductase subunit C)